MRTIVDLPEEQIKALDTYRKLHRISRAEAVRRAVAAFIPAKSHKKVDFRRHPAFGSSKTFRKEDSVELVRRLRDQWE
jgi:metal-responsive CopG/Arc/MetJ family transcriptional regulator